MDLIETVDCEDFRRSLAGLASTDAAVYDAEAFKAAGIKLGFVMAKLFNRKSLEPITLWERIGNGIRSASAKVGNGDTDYFISLCLEFVLAKDSLVAADEDCGALIFEMANQEEAFRRQWIRYLHNRVYVITTFARERWSDYKDRDKFETLTASEDYAI